MHVVVVCVPVLWFTYSLSWCRYETMRHNIAQRYAEIERQLVDKFCEALRSSDVKRMKKFASTLQLFQRVSTACNYMYLCINVECTVYTCTVQCIYVSIITPRHVGASRVKQFVLSVSVSQSMY